MGIQYSILDYTGHPPYLWFCFRSCSFSYPQSTEVPKYYMENSRNKQFIHFKLGAILSSFMNSLPILSTPSWGVNRPFVERIHAV